MKFSLVPFVCTALLLAACGKPGSRTDAAGADGGVTTTGAVGATAAASGSGDSVELSFENLGGLKADAPKGTKSMVGLGLSKDGQMIMGPGFTANLNPAPGTKPAKLEDEKAFVTKMYKDVSNVKEEKLADGWSLSFDVKGGSGMLYQLDMRREIDGKPYWCSVLSQTPEGRDKALAVCKSVRK